MTGRVLIVGATGLVGGGLRRAFDAAGIEWRGTAKRSEKAPDYIPCDIEDAEDVRGAVMAARPEVVVQTAALTHVDYCEEHPGEAWKQNVEGTRNTARAAEEAGARFVFFSSDYVFDGTSGPYGEEDATRPLSVYGKTKLEGERAAEAAPGSLIVRTTVVYGWDPVSKNFLMQLDARLGRGEKMRVPVDQWSTPTEADDLGECVAALLEEGMEGVFHVTGPDLMNRYDFAAAAAEALGYDTGLLETVRTEELGQAAPRPLRAGMTVRKFREATGRTPIGVAEGLRRFCEKRAAWRKDSC